MDANLHRAECRLSALALFQAAILDQDPIGARNVLENTPGGDITAGLLSLLEIVLHSWATSTGTTPGACVDVLRAANLAIQGVTE